MLRGFMDQDLIYGSTVFDKLQIKSVTSHFKNGMLFLVVYAKEPSPSAQRYDEGYVVSIMWIIG